MKKRLFCCSGLKADSGTVMGITLTEFSDKNTIPQSRGDAAGAVRKRARLMQTEDMPEHMITSANGHLQETNYEK